MGKAKASAGLRIGEGALRWASLSGEDAGAALIAATGASASELMSLVNDNQSVIPQVAAVLCEDVDAVLTAWSAGELDVSHTRAMLRAELGALVFEAEGDDNGHI